MSELSEHLPTLMAFAKDFGSPKPDTEQLQAAMVAGLVNFHIEGRISGAGETIRQSWRLSRAGRDLLQAYLRTLPESAWPKPKRRKPRTVKRTKVKRA